MNFDIYARYSVVYFKGVSIRRDISMQVLFYIFCPTVNILHIIRVTWLLQITN